MQLKTETKVGLFVLIAIILLCYSAVYFGTFHFNTKNYNNYYLYFDDLSGLEKKSDVKIFGIKVGWIADIKMLSENKKPKVKITINKDYNIYKNAKACIKSDTILGNKYLEINPGNETEDKILPGQNFSNQVESLVSIETLIKKFDKIANNIEEVSSSLKNMICKNSQQEQLKEIIKNINEASYKIAIFSESLSRNEKNIDNLLNNLNLFSKNIIPLGDQINKVTDKLYIDILPSFQNNVQKISDVVDRDFNRVATKLDLTLENINSLFKKGEESKSMFAKLVRMMLK